jgi:glyoxylase-like metal-dependent hydrolase (beta-lactamase superfamily II)
MNEWFTVTEVDECTSIISEYRHWEETHCYLLEGTEHCLLIDTGLGICNIASIVAKLTDKPIIVVATHIHWDHIGGHKHFTTFYAHHAELHWLTGKFPLSIEAVRQMVVKDCTLPSNYDVTTYELFQGTPTKLLTDGDQIDLGGRTITVIHTPGHSPGHMCFYEEATGYLYTGDLVYKGILLAFYPSTDPQAYLRSLKKISSLPITKVLPGHHDLKIKPEIIQRMKIAFQQLAHSDKLKHGSGLFNYGDWSLHI